MEDDSTFPLTSSETDFSPSTLSQWLCSYALEQSSYTVYISELVSWREIAAGGRFWELHSAWAWEFQGAFFFFSSLVLTASIIGTLLIPEGCGGLCNFLQELDWKLLWNSQFSVWCVVLWASLSAWLSNVVTFIYHISWATAVCYYSETNCNLLPWILRKRWKNRYLEDEMWGRNSTCWGAPRVRWYDEGSCFGGHGRMGVKDQVGALKGRNSVEQPLWRRW